MNIYLIECADAGGMDQYDSAVVAALTADDARHIHPNGTDNLRTMAPRKHWEQNWTNDPSRVEVTLIGVITDDAEFEQSEGVILASNNPG